MSDGPHRSLPMRRGWKRVAKCADNRAFDADEIRNAIVPALEQDCRGEVSPEFLSRLYRVCLDHESSLFKGDVRPNLEALRGEAGSGMGRIALDYATQAAANGSSGLEIAEKAMTEALTDRAARGIRQVEEHYCRESTKTRANKVRERVEQAISSADIGGAARRLLKLEPKKSAGQSLKRQGLDDGVKL